MKRVQEKARTTLQQRGEAMRKYYDRRATPQPEIKMGDLVMLNATNIKSKRPTIKFAPLLDGSFKGFEKKSL